MAFHPEKCNVLTITKKRNPIKFNDTLHGHSLEHVTSAKYLGCTITSDLKWGPHINNICNKANSTIGFLKRNLNTGIAKKSVKERAYQSLVRPSLEYQFCRKQLTKLANLLMHSQCALSEPISPIRKTRKLTVCRFI